MLRHGTQTTTILRS
uniref:Uncharacterized protein n=1 Tax=Arundo donax TaxID=35708 RepID=A0A0A9G304_ARUDO